jgi:hypothetical protein
MTAPTKPSMSDLIGGSLDEFGALPREEHIEKSLAQPDAAGALTLGRINNVSKARMRHQFANVLALEIPHIQEALRELQKENPKVYLEKVMELAEFSLPRLKSVEIDVSANAESARSMSIADLQRALNDDNVVSVQ